MGTGAEPSRRRALAAHPTGARQHLALAIGLNDADDDAVRWVADRSGTRVLDVELVTVVDEAPEATLAVRATGAADRLQHAAAFLATAAPSAQTRLHVLTGGVRRSLQRFARAVDLVVLGRDGAAARAVALAGRVAAASERPAVLVPRAWRPSLGPVVLPLEADGAEEEAARFAEDEADASHRELVLLHDRRPRAERPFSALAGATALEDVAAEARARHPGLRVVPRPVAGHPADEAVRAGSAALVVLPISGRSVTDRPLLGSVSADAIEHCGCPVAIVPPQP